MERLRDPALVTALVSSPVWVEWLERVNVVLTLVTLLLGLVIGVLRIRAMWRGREKESR